MKKELLIAAMSAMLVLSGCESSSSDNNNDGGGEGSSATSAPFNATDSTQEHHFSLASGSVVTDDTWHISYQKYVGFRTKAGTTTCVAKTYDALYDAQNASVADEFKALTIANTEDAFNGVTLADCAEEDYQADTINTQIKTSDWLSADYSTGAPIFAASTDANNSWIIRSASGDDYARVKVKTVTVLFGATTTRQVVLESELFDTTNNLWLPAQDSPVMDFSSETVYWDMETNTLTTATDTNAVWDLSLKVDGRDYPIQVNGGASGNGQAGTGILMVDSTADVTDPTATNQVYKYFGDTAEGAMSTPGNYGALQYAVDGGHKMWPTFSVYIIKDGENYYKAQIISNYGEDGSLESGNLVVRYEQLSE